MTAGDSNGAGGLSGTATKGSVFRGFLLALKNNGQWDDVRARVPTATRTLMDHPPVDSEWISHRSLNDLYQALEQLRGPAELRRVVKDAVGTSHKLAQPMIQGLFRLFGATPSTLLSRMNMLSSSVTRGVDFEYRETGARAGLLTAIYRGVPEVPASMLVAMEASLELAAELCAARGTCQLEKASRDGADTRAVFFIRW